MNVVLAHGILGIGKKKFNSGINYFNGVRKLFEARGISVFEPSVNPLGSLETRSSQLAEQLETYSCGDADIIIIAHSMGGLDARRVINKYEIGTKIRKLITISTPHFGSPVADAVLGQNIALLQKIPAPLRENLRKATGAINDLTTRSQLQDPDRDWVEYVEIACTTQQKPFLLKSHFFSLAQAIGQMYGPNDGVVPYESASKGLQAAHEWHGVDHGEAIGWPSGLWGLQAIGAAVSPPAKHLERYRWIAETFLQS